MVVFWNVLPEDTMEQVTHKIQDKSGITPCNVSLYGRFLM